MLSPKPWIGRYGVIWSSDECRDYIGLYRLNDIDCIFMDVEIFVYFILVL